MSKPVKVATCAKSKRIEKAPKFSNPKRKLDVRKSQSKTTSISAVDDAEQSQSSL